MATLTVRAAGEATEILLYGAIGKDPFFGDGVSAEEFRAAVKKAKGKLLNLRINSPGGSVFEASAMTAALDEFKGRIEADVDGVAASAASVVAMAAHEIRMATGSMMMIHNPHALVMGGAAQMRRMADTLDAAKEQLLDAYERHSRAGRDQLAAWLDEEKWFTPAEAVEAGLAHAVTGASAIAASADFRALAAKFGYRHVPASLTAPPAADPTAWEETRRRQAIAAKLREAT